MKKNDKRVKQRFQNAIKIYRNSKNVANKALQVQIKASRDLLTIRKEMITEEAGAAPKPGFQTVYHQQLQEFKQDWKS